MNAFQLIAIAIYSLLYSILLVTKQSSLFQFYYGFDASLVDSISVFVCVRIRNIVWGHSKRGHCPMLAGNGDIKLTLISTVTVTHCSLWSFSTWLFLSSFKVNFFFVRILYLARIILIRKNHDSNTSILP